MFSFLMGVLVLAVGIFYLAIDYLPMIGWLQVALGVLGITMHLLRVRAEKKGRGVTWPGEE